MTNEERKAALEAIIYAADEPATLEQLAKALGEEKLAVQASLDELVRSCASEERGIEVRAVAGGFKLYTKPQQHDVVRRFIKSLRPPLRLSMPALETLAVIAYKQPVTGPEISEIRDVNSSGVLATLLDKRLITTAGRKEAMPAAPTAETLENLTAAQSPSFGHSSAPIDSCNPLTTDLADNDQLVPTEFAAADVGLRGAGALGAASAPGPSPSSSQSSAPSDDEFLREREVESTAEGMPSGELDEEPPKAESASAGE